MVVAVSVCLVALGVVLTAVYRERPRAAPPPSPADWDLVPTVAEVSHTDFPLAFPGYDPASVERHLDAVRRAYGDLLAVAPPDVVHRARRRAALRAGRDPDALFPPRTLERAPQEAGADAAAPDEADDGEALRVEAAAAGMQPAAGEPQREPGAG